MARRLIALNVLLLALAGWLGFRLNREWKEYRRAHDVALLTPLREMEPLKTADSLPPPAKVMETAEISARNPFSFDRNDVPIFKPIAASAAPARPKPFLFGTFASGSEKVAMLGPGDPGSRRFRPLKTGEVIDGWKVVEISSKSVIVENNGKKETVIMNDPTAQTPRDYSRTSAAAPAVTVQGANSSSPSSNSPAPPANGGPPVATPPAGTPGKTRVIQTPFGNKVVPDPPQ